MGNLYYYSLSLLPLLSSLLLFIYMRLLLLLLLEVIGLLIHKEFLPSNPIISSISSDINYPLFLLRFIGMIVTPSEITQDEVAMTVSMHTPTTINGALIKALRIHFEMTQADLAHMAELNIKTICDLEQGTQTSARLTTLNAIAKAFNINTAQLLKTENEFPHNSSLAATIAARI